jgi:phosphohistidine phosphatase
MDLILWRHADAESGIPDAERRLTVKGRRQAETMAAWLRKRLPEDAAILVSPARRAQETARALTKQFETVGELGADATPQSLLAAAGWPDGGSATVVVVGHQPTLGRAAALALTGRPDEWSVRKGAIWWLARRARQGETIVRAVIGPDLLQ